MRSLTPAGKPTLMILLMLAALLAATFPVAAVTIHITYADAANEGFNDPRPLTQDEIDILSRNGNSARTLGEARKNALERATSILEGRLGNSNTIRIRAEFVFFDGQEDPLNPGQCSSSISGSTTIGFAGPTGYGYTGSKLDIEFDNSDPPVQINAPGRGTSHPYALFEALGNQNLNGQEDDIRFKLSKCVRYYYGFTGTVPQNTVDFIQLVIHEIMHGIGFLSEIESDGSFPVRNLILSGTLGGRFYDNLSASVESRAVYDEQLYSEADNASLAGITEARRRAAITSEDGLSWEGTDGGIRSCSYGVKMAELTHPSAKSGDGKPLLHAPASFNDTSSVSHVFSSAGDTMEAFAPSPRNMKLSLGILRDVGWNVSGLAPDCNPTGITVRPLSQLVTTESGGTAKFEVSLGSRPSANVVIPLASYDTSEGDVPGGITFTPSTWKTSWEVTVRGVPDGICDGIENYKIQIGPAQSGDRFYSGFDPVPKTLSLENHPSLPALSIENSSAGEGDGAIELTVNLAHPRSDQSVTVQYEITEGTAKEGSDYVDHTGGQPLPITFAPCETRKTISVALVDDKNADGDKTFTARLLNPQNARIDRNTATATIRDDEQPPTTRPPTPAPNPTPAPDPDPDPPSPPVEETPEEERTTTSQDSSGGGGCALAPDKKADHPETALARLLLGAAALLPLLSRKNLSAE